MAKSLLAQNGIAGALALAGVVGISGCTFTSNMIEPNRLDYKAAGKATTTKLDVPPDLTQIRRDNRYAIPEASQGTASASSFNLKSDKNLPVGTTVALNNLNDMRIDRDGAQRWLVVKQKPEVLWPLLKDFWQDLGFQFGVENQEAGILETDWVENRAKIPHDIIRDTIGKYLNTLYSTGERDKYRTRLERGADGTVEIFISHRGAQEVFIGQQKDTTMWTSRPTDSGLEAEILSRLLVKLGTSGEVAKAAVVPATPTVKDRARLLSAEGTSFVETDEGFDRSWRRVGLALDRVGFTVEDRDRTKGIYFVRYIDEDIDAKKKGAGEGFFSKLFSKSDDDSKNKQRYLINVKEKGEISIISVYKTDGKVDSSPVAAKILKLLQEQLK